MSKFSLLLFVAFYSTAICAAQNGSLGQSSTASAKISFTKHAVVHLSKLDDFNLNKPSSLGGDVWHDDICVISSSGAYKITTYSQRGTSTAYRMSNKNLTRSIDYSINFSPDSISAGDVLLPGVESAVYTSEYDKGCSRGTSPRVFLSVDKSSLDAADPSGYVDVLTFIVHPI